MAFDFKKEYKEFYLPPKKPVIITVPPMNYLAVTGKGDPNQEDGDYKRAIGVLYGVAYTLKMSYKTDHRIEGFFEYVVPPLEGFWRQEGIKGFDITKKAGFIWTSVIRVPEFITPEDVEWAKDTASRKKGIDCSGLELITVDEGLCVQIMHIGAYDNEPESVALMDSFIAEQGYRNDMNDLRLHHEIYLSDVRKVSQDKWKTVIRHPVAQV